MKPVLLVSVDTEEEFDWSAPFSASQRSVGHVARLPRLQELFDRLGVRATYLIDHPIAVTPSSVRVLDGFLQRGTCEIGAHLHPWVNPPLSEEINSRNSYLGNLPLALQQDKVAELTAAITRSFARAPLVFKAGRYGLDFALIPFLAELGYRVDSSIMAYANLTEDGGPSWEAYGPEPFWLELPNNSAGEALLEIPCTSGFVRRPFWFWAKVRRLVGRKPWCWLRLGGLLWHLGLLRRVMLTPEGPALADLRNLLRALSRGPAPVLNVTLHSPSIEPGHTPYVRSEEELEQFLALLTQILEIALGELGAQCMTLGEYNESLRQKRREAGMQPAAGPGAWKPAPRGEEMCRS
jgi:hypothetical protein